MFKSCLNHSVFPRNELVIVNYQTKIIAPKGRVYVITYIYRRDLSIIQYYHILI